MCILHRVFNIILKLYHVTFKCFIEACLLFLPQFDALVAALPISKGDEEAQLKRIAELQVWSSQLVNSFLYLFIFKCNSMILWFIKLNQTRESVSNLV